MMDISSMLNGDGKANEQRQENKCAEDLQDLNHSNDEIPKEDDSSLQHADQTNNSTFSSIYTSRELPYSSPTSDTRKISMSTSAQTNLPSHSTNHQATKRITSKESTPAIKSEARDSPFSAGLDQDISSMDNATRAAILQAQNEHGTRDRKPSRRDADTLESTPISPPPPAAQSAVTKKRPANSKALPAGVKKPPPKKRKIDQAKDVTSKRSATPVSRTSKTSAAKIPAKNPSQSGTPRNSSPTIDQASDDGTGSVADSDMDSQPYCICRKPDNHTWMIGCDGGCNDWYHGKCVQMKQEDEPLIDKYICPLCTEAGKGVTTWKPMCRNGTCRNPARVRSKPPSKYCSDACGIEFFTKKLSLTSQNQEKPPQSTDGGVADQPDLGSRGGAIRADELKSLLDSVTDAQEFRRLGSVELPTPPTSGSPQRENFTELNELRSGLSKQEDERLEEISKKKDVLRERHALLKDRKRFVTFAKERAQRAATKTKVKELCGFDDRLSWDDKVFAEWRQSEEGKRSFTQESLDDEADDKTKQSDEQDQDQSDNASLQPRPQIPTKRDSIDSYHLCTRRRCTRHVQWQKLALQDVRFEEADVGDEMRRVDGEEKEIWRSAAIKSRLKPDNDQQDIEGSVEVIDST